jgi:hypothetical protein
MSANEYKCKSKEVATVPYIAYKLLEAKYRRKTKKLIVALIFSIIIAIVSTAIMIGVI